jgi:hypothetical protein
MGRSHGQRLEARRRALEDKVVVYALTSRRPPDSLVMAHRQAYLAAEAARGETPAARRAPRARGGLLGRWFGA